MAAEVVRWNHLSRGILGLGSDEDKEFVEEYIKYCGSGPATSCSTIMQKWKQVSYKKNAGLNDVQIQDWESSVNQIYKHYIGYCKNTDASCNAILRMAKDYYMVSYGGMKEMLIQMELSMYTYLNGGVAAIKNQTIPYIAEGVNGVVNLGKPRASGRVQMSGGSSRNNSNTQNNSSSGGLITSSHASIRKLQGRNVGVAQNDLQRARQSDIFIQSDGRYVVRGKNGREHIIEPHGEVVTTINNRSNSSHLNKVQNGERRPATNQEYSFIKQFSGN